MNDRIKRINDFFESYVTHFNEGLVEPAAVVGAIAENFAEKYVAASPGIVRAGANNEGFKTALDAGLTFYRSIGIRSMEVLSNDITFLDETHAVSKVHWRSRFSRPDGRDGDVAFDVFYMIQERGGTIKIFAWVSGDEQKVFRDLGLVPAAAMSPESS